MNCCPRGGYGDVSAPAESKFFLLLPICSIQALNELEEAHLLLQGPSLFIFKRHLLLGRKAMIKLDSVLKSRDITFLTKVPIVKAMISPVVMNGYESWTIKKAEH